MSKHTPGPWTRNPQGFSPVTKQSNSEWCIDTTTRPTGPLAVVRLVGVEDVPIDEAEANARLIAAAPELLEAALHVIEMTTLIPAIPDGASVYVTSTAIADLRSAIAKAEGDAS